MWDFFFQMYFFVVGLFLVVMTFFLYFEKNKKKDSFVQEGLTTANMSRLAAISYALEHLPSSIIVDDYAAIRDNVKAMIGLTNQLEVKNSLDANDFKTYVDAMKKNIDMCLDALQGTNSGLILKEQYFDLIMDSLKNKFKEPY